MDTEPDDHFLLREVLFGEIGLHSSSHATQANASGTEF
jgi:hypothetical protein